MRDKKKIEDQIAELRDRVNKLELLMKTHKHDYSELTGTIPQHEHKGEDIKIHDIDLSRIKLRRPGRGR